MPYLKSFGGVKEHTIEIQNSFVNVIGQRKEKLFPNYMQPLAQSQNYQSEGRFDSLDIDNCRNKS
jgi:hypothetical protein